MRINTKLLKPRYLATLFFSMSVAVSIAQVGINTTTPDGVLDLNSDEEKYNGGVNKYGLVLPRVALIKNDISSPVVDPSTGTPGSLPIGTVVYNTATTNYGSNSVYPGIYMWDGIDWINEFPKKDAEIFKQTPPLTALRTVTSGSYQNIPNLANRTFTPEYSGTYKVELSMNWGGGIIQNLGTGTDVAVQSGIFKFEFNSDPDKLIPMHTWSARHGSGTNYYDIWEQTTIVIYKELVAGTSYPFSLSFDQTNSDGFTNNGNSGDGMGWLGGDIPCTVEFVYLD